MSGGSAGVQAPNMYQWVSSSGLSFELDMAFNDIKYRELIAYFLEPVPEAAG